MNNYVMYKLFYCHEYLQVMTAASYWSLLNPAIEMAEHSGFYGDKGQWAFVPVAIGFVFGAAFVYGADIFMPYLVREKRKCTFTYPL